MALTKKAYDKLNQNKDGIRFIRPFSEYTLKEVIETITELEELKKEHELTIKLFNSANEKLNSLERDVKRYFELRELQTDEAMFPTEYLFTDVDWKELYYLEEKLSKVGKEDV